MGIFLVDFAKFWLYILVYLIVLLTRCVSTRNSMLKKTLRSHTFNGKKYLVEFTGRIDGMTDTPDVEGELPRMVILDNNNLRAFHSAMHEAMEAMGMCDKCLHKENGDFATWDIASFLWRWIKTRLPKSDDIPST